MTRGANADDRFAGFDEIGNRLHMSKLGSTATDTEKEGVGVLESGGDIAKVIGIIFRKEKLTAVLISQLGLGKNRKSFGCFVFPLTD